MLWLLLPNYYVSKRFAFCMFPYSAFLHIFLLWLFSSVCKYDCRCYKLGNYIVSLVILTVMHKFLAKLCTYGFCYSLEKCSVLWIYLYCNMLVYCNLFLEIACLLSWPCIFWNELFIPGKKNFKRMVQASFSSYIKKKQKSKGISFQVPWTHYFSILSKTKSFKELEVTSSRDPVFRDDYPIETEWKATALTGWGVSFREAFSVHQLERKEEAMKWGQLQDQSLHLEQIPPESCSWFLDSLLMLYILTLERILLTNISS